MRGVWKLVAEGLHEGVSRVGVGRERQRRDEARTLDRFLDPVNAGRNREPGGVRDRGLRAKGVGAGGVGPERIGTEVAVGGPTLTNGDVGQ